jgi:hypothetical protein
MMRGCAAAIVDLWAVTANERPVTDQRLRPNQERRVGFGERRDLVLRQGDVPHAHFSQTAIEISAGRMRFAEPDLIRVVDRRRVGIQVRCYTVVVQPHRRRARPHAA